MFLKNVFNSAPNNFDYHQYGNGPNTSCFQSKQSQIFYESLYLYLKQLKLLLSSCTVWSSINHNGNVPILYMQVGKNIGMIVLLPSVNMLRF